MSTTTPNQILTLLKKIEQGYENKIQSFKTTGSFIDKDTIKLNEDNLKVVKDLIKQQKHMANLGGFEAIISLAKQGAAAQPSIF